MRTPSAILIFAVACQTSGCSRTDACRSGYLSFTDQRNGRRFCVLLRSATAKDKENLVKGPRLVATDQAHVCNVYTEGVISHSPASRSAPWGS